MNKRKKFPVRSWYRTNRIHPKLEQLETRDVPSSFGVGESKSPITLIPNDPADIGQGSGPGTSFQTQTILGYIVTPYDRIPNFGSFPTVTAVAGGAWSNPSTWSTGALPTAGDIVSIGAGVAVTYDVVSDVTINTVGIQSGGSLRFHTDVNTKLTVINLLVMEGGELQIGTTATPVAPTVKAEVVFANVPLDLVNDPQQYGNGLIALGKVTMIGSAKSQTFVRLASEPHAGDTTLRLTQSISGWAVGDRLLLPDTRQNVDANSQSERPTLASVSADGLTLTLTQPVQFDHRGAYDDAGVQRFLPHVGVLSRNVVIRSQSATGTRGHTFFTGRADVDIRFAAFNGLGRTTNAWPDNTVLDGNGVVTHLGTNQMGRYSVHFAHVVGPAAVPANGYQYTFVGNAVMCPIVPMPFRWGVNINGSDYGLVKDNVLYNWAGAGIVGEAASESFNRVEHNFVVRITGGGGRADTRNTTDDIGFEGSGLWFRGPNNYVKDNVVADGGQYGYSYYQLYVGFVRVPKFQGADRSVEGQYLSVNMNSTALRQFVGNEVYGTPIGLTFWWLGTWFNTAYTETPENLVLDFRAWNFSTYGYYGYQAFNVTFDGYVALGDKVALATSLGGIGLFFSDYYTSNFTARNSDIQNQRRGIEVSSFVQGYTKIEDSFFANTTNVWIATIGAPGSSPDGHSMFARQSIFRNVLFSQVHGLGGPQYDFYLQSGDQQGSANYVISDTTYVYNYNRVTGDNFQVYYQEQSPDRIIPQSTTWLVGSPISGWTNQQNWDVYGIAIAGALAPSNQSRSGILGYVAPIGGLTGGILVGQVFRDNNKNGVVDSGEGGEPNLTTYVDLNNNKLREPGEPYAVTDANGKYSLPVSADGSYLTRIELAFGSPLVRTSADPAAHNVAGGSTVAVSPAFGVANINGIGGKLAGHVFHDANKNGVQNSGELGEPNIVVYVDVNSNKSRDAVEPWMATDSKGYYSLAVNADGLYTVRLEMSAGSGVQQTTTNPSAQLVANGATVTVSPAFGIASIGGAGGNANGVIFFDANGNGKRDPGEKGQSGLKVYVDANSNGKLDPGEINAVTITDGTFSLAVANNGIYVVREIAPNGTSFTTAGAITVTLNAGNAVNIAFGNTTSFATGEGAGGAPRVKLFNPDGSVRMEFDAYAPSFSGGVRVATGDVSGDGVADIVTAPGVGGGPDIRVFSGSSGQLIREFYAYDASFSGGVFVAVGDVNGDGFADIITGAGAGGGPHVIAFDGKTGGVLSSFFAYDSRFSGGVNVAAGDLDRDGKADIVTGPGPGGGPHIRAFNAVGGVLFNEFFAYDATFTGGVNVATGDLNGDGVIDFITGAGTGGGPHVRGFSGADGKVLRDFFAYDPTFTGGVRVSALDLYSDGRVYLVTSPGRTNLVSPGTSNKVRAFDPAGNVALELDPFTGFLGGSYVG